MNDVPNDLIDRPPAAVPPRSDPPDAVPPAPGCLRTLVSSQWFSYAATPLAFLLILGPLFGLWLGGRFLDADARVFDVFTNAPVIILALGVLFCLLAGHFDLSVGPVAGLAGVLTLGLRANEGLPFGLVIAIVLAVGLLAGAVNGVLVTTLRINAFIATLGTGAVYAGIATAYTGGSATIGASGPTPVPQWFSGVGSYSSATRAVPTVVVLGLALLVAAATLAVIREQTTGWLAPRRYAACAAAVLVIGAATAVANGRASWPVGLVLALTLLVWATLRYTVFGRRMIASGANTVAARLAGINVERHVFGAFVISGLFATLAGMVLSAGLGAASPSDADSFLLPAYAAVFLSTVLVSSGRFHPWGVLVGALAVVYVRQGLITGGVPYTWTSFLNGLVLLIAVGVSTLTRRRETR